jgi:hypothetical protein
MSNTSSDNWDHNSPADAAVVSAGALEIRVLREGVEERLGKEHVTPATGGVGGEHLPGSGRTYMGDYHSAWPSKKPDGEKAIDTEDKGRIAVDTTSTPNRLAIWTGAAWVSLTDLLTTLDIATLKADAITLDTNNSYLKAKDAAGTGTKDILKVNGTDGIEFAAGIKVNGAVDIAGKITTVTDPTSAQDAATKAYVDLHTGKTVKQVLYALYHDSVPCTTHLPIDASKPQKQKERR